MKTLPEIIRAEAAASGILTFARFMELALYCPDFGYYETQKDTVGRRGDFYTSVSTGKLFGELLAFQFADWLAEFKTQDSKVKIIETGAHDGRLAKDILNWLQLRRPKLFEQLEYCIIEPSARRQQWQRATLKEFDPYVRWFGGFQSIAAGSPQLNGLIFSNELLDALPVHRFGWDAKNKKWFEWGVTVAGGKFAWAKIQNPGFKILEAELASVLPDGYIVETSPAAENWWRQAAGILAHGRLLTIDYGLAAEELFSPSRLNGTLRAYFQHQISDDLLANIGEQDLTAHINFSAIQKAGEAAGLKTVMFSTQAKFLTEILKKTLADKTFGEWNAGRTRQFQALTHPEHLGRAFRVLVQSR
jgi:SAM-dependent MidA family methyltransferase